MKKKKKKRAIQGDVAALEAQLEEAGITESKDADIEGDEVSAEPHDEKEEEKAWLKSDRDYTYEEVLLVSHILLTSPASASYFPDSSRE